MRIRESITVAREDELLISSTQKWWARKRARGGAM